MCTCTVCRTMHLVMISVRTTGGRSGFVHYQLTASPQATEVDVSLEIQLGHASMILPFVFRLLAGLFPASRVILSSRRFVSIQIASQLTGEPATGGNFRSKFLPLDRPTDPRAGAAGGHQNGPWSPPSPVPGEVRGPLPADHVRPPQTSGSYRNLPTPHRAGPNRRGAFSGARRSPPSKARTRSSETGRQRSGSGGLLLRQGTERLERPAS